MARKVEKATPIPRSELEEQIARDRVMFDKLSVNVRRARREELEQVWPEAYLPDAEEPELPLGGDASE